MERDNELQIEGDLKEKRGINEWEQSSTATSQLYKDGKKNMTYP